MVVAQAAALGFPGMSLANAGAEISVFGSSTFLGTGSIVAASAAGGAAGGFVSGVSLGAMGGEHFGQTLESGIKGAEYGAIQGAVTAGVSAINDSLPSLKINPISKTDPYNVTAIIARGLEGAATSKLENKNASAGFWGGIISGSEQLFKPGSTASLQTSVVNDLTQGAIGGLGSMNKHGKGFMNGFWSVESAIITSAAGNLAESDLLRAVDNGVASGATTRFGGKLFAAGFYAGFDSETLKDGVYWLERNAPPPQPQSTVAPVNAALKLLTPKQSKKGVILPLDSISGGTWANGAPWEQLY